MEENNRKGPGVFYAVMGVATLVVAIIGATFAYFSISVTGNNDQSITGTTATGVSLTLSVTNSTNVTGAFVPLDTMDPYYTATSSQLPAALANDTVCTDDAGNAVCNVYTVTISGEDYGTTALNVIGTLKLDVKDSKEAAVTNSNIKWKLINSTDGSTFTDNADATVNPSDGTTAYITANTTGGETLNATTTSRTYYLVVWLEETGSGQDTPDAALSFTGTVTFNAVDTSGTGGSTNLTATFTA